MEEFFTVVHYDQRGAGRSYRLSEHDELRPAMTIDHYVQDAAELVEWLRAEINIEQVILVGHSWGTVVATTLAYQRPDLVKAYLGIGQVIDFRAGEKASCEAIATTTPRARSPPWTTGARISGPRPTGTSSVSRCFSPSSSRWTSRT